MNLQCTPDFQVLDPFGVGAISEGNVGVLNFHHHLASDPIDSLNQRNLFATTTIILMFSIPIACSHYHHLSVVQYLLALNHLGMPLTFYVCYGGTFGVGGTRLGTTTAWLLACPLSLALPAGDSTGICAVTVVAPGRRRGPQSSHAQPW